MNWSWCSAKVRALWYPLSFETHYSHILNLIPNRLKNYMNIALTHQTQKNQIHYMVLVELNLIQNRLIESKKDQLAGKLVLYPFAPC
jgi:hypothetical protein